MADTLEALPAEGPATLEAAKLQLGITDERSNDLLTMLVGVVNGLIRGVDQDDDTTTTAWRCTRPARGAEDWTGLEPVVYGASMLVARLYQRRNSPLGYEQVGELTAVYVSRNDPDLAQLLQLGSYARPSLG